MSRVGRGTFLVPPRSSFLVSLKWILDHAMAQLLGQRHRVHARHGDMAGIQHQADILRLGIFHDVHGLLFVLDLAAQMRMDAELHAQFLADALAEQVQVLAISFNSSSGVPFGCLRGPVLVFCYCSRSGARSASCRVIVHRGLALGRILEGNVAVRRAAGDGGELCPNLIHAVLQGFPAIGIIDFAPDLLALGIFPAIAVRPSFHRLGIARRRLIAIRGGAEGRTENLEIAKPTSRPSEMPTKGCLPSRRECWWYSRREIAVAGLSGAWTSIFGSPAKAGPLDWPESARRTARRRRRKG